MPSGPSVRIDSRSMFAGEEVVEIMARRQPEDDIDVGQAEIGVKDEDAFAHAGEQHRQVGHDRCFADTALAAGDGKDPGGGRLSEPLLASVSGIVHGPQGACLICGL